MYTCLFEFKKRLEHDICHSFPFEWKHSIFMNDSRVTIALSIIQSILDNTEIHTLEGDKLVAYNFYKEFSQQELLAIVRCITDFFLHD
jgi:hypothetical protein